VIVLKMLHTKTIRSTPQVSVYVNIYLSTVSTLIMHSTLILCINSSLFLPHRTLKSPTALLPLSIPLIFCQAGLISLWMLLSWTPFYF